MPDAVATYAGAPSAATGAATGPGSGGIITGATLTLGIGRWEISVEAAWGATAGTQDNIQLKVVQGNPAVTTFYPLAMSGGASSIPSVSDRIMVVVYPGPSSAPSATATVSVNAIAADGTGVYNVNLIARPLMV